MVGLRAQPLRWMKPHRVPGGQPRTADSIAASVTRLVLSWICIQSSTPSTHIRVPETSASQWAFQCVAYLQIFFSCFILSWLSCGSPDVVSSSTSSDSLSLWDNSIASSPACEQECRVTQSWREALHNTPEPRCRGRGSGLCWSWSCECMPSRNLFENCCHCNVSRPNN